MLRSRQGTRDGGVSHLHTARRANFSSASRVPVRHTHHLGPVVPPGRILSGQRWNSTEPTAWGLEERGKNVPQESGHGVGSAQLWTQSPSPTVLRPSLAFLGAPRTQQNSPHFSDLLGNHETFNRLKEVICLLSLSV